MLVKIVLLLCVSAALALNLRATPEELQTLMQEVDATIKSKEHEAQIEIRVNLIANSYYTSNARTYIIGNLTEAARPYWNEIASLQEQATTNGQDISACIELGNNQLYALNDTTVLPLLQQISSYYDQGNIIIYNSAAAAASTVEELLALETRVGACSDNECATELTTELVAFYQRAVDTINEAVDSPYQYVQVNLESNLEKINIDTATYARNYALYLDDIRRCINLL